jgi:hypothetical protein
MQQVCHIPGRKSFGMIKGRMKIFFIKTEKQKERDKESKECI